MKQICNFVEEDVNAGYFVMSNVSRRHICLSYPQDRKALKLDAQKRKRATSSARTAAW
ncbi:hypothetical protein CO2235_MP80510 [Cupriavidus oxalaticus]|uniref:Uncharacterized protein n=1 Tax=Cupriavidus oxalaticus TaxID=96344 RepID=A0A976BKF9_9BURK|nr:hypothetical protein CO2235_MP80510 [Cupriavidus oxalaticus]